MKIGILTFHCAHNYGAVLQCYALQETLKNMGHDVEVIDYRPRFLVEPYKPFNIKWFIRRNIFKVIRRFIHECSIYKIRFKRYKVFNSFINNKLNISSRVYKGIIPDKYDIYVIGSDQVWNKSLTNGDSIYWGNFRISSNRRKITYAASMEAQDIDANYAQQISKYLDNFNFISVREYNLRDLLNSIYNKKKINIVLDPTFLAEKKIWTNIMIKPKRKKYVLIYEFAINENTANIAKKIASEIGADVLDINVDLLNKKNNGVISLLDLSPEQFLGYFSEACFIITSTFHGTAFSVIFNKPFYFIKIGNKESQRVNTLLENLNLSDRIISDRSLPKYMDIDYSKREIIIEELRIKSLSYIRDACN